MSNQQQQTALSKTGIEHSFSMIKAEEAKGYANYLFTQKLIPQTFTSVNQVFMAVHTAVSFGFERFAEINMALKNMYIVHGKVTLYGDLPLSLVYSSGKLEYKDEFFLDANSERICLKNKNASVQPHTAVCVLKRTDEETIHEHFLTLEDLKDSGIKVSEDGKISNPQNPVWSKHSKVMWARRVAGRALRNVFPDVLMGCSVDEARKPEETVVVIDATKKDSAVQDVLRKINGGKKDEAPQKA